MPIGYYSNEPGLLAAKIATLRPVEIHDRTPFAMTVANLSLQACQPIWAHDMPTRSHSDKLVPLAGKITIPQGEMIRGK